MTVTLEGSYLDPKLILHLDDEKNPFFDEYWRQYVLKGGYSASMALDLKEHLEEMDRKRNEAPEDTQQFEIIEWEGECCPHLIPLVADCMQCLEGIAPTTEWGKDAVIVSSVYGKTTQQRQRWYRKLWRWVKGH